MPKTPPIPCTREEMDNIIEACKDDDFCYMLFKVARKTGRRLGEYYGSPRQIVIKEEKYIDHDGKEKIKQIKKNDYKHYEGGVKVKDIDYDRRIMMTLVLKRRQKVMKEAILDDELIYLIKTYIQRNKLKLEDYLFRKVGYRQIQNKIVTYAKKAGVPHKVSFHNFRHYFVTELFKKGWTYDKIAKLTGHSSAGTLALYDHTVASDVADEARKDIMDI